MSKIRKNMMSRYITLMLVLVIGLLALVISMKNYYQIQNTQAEIDALIEKTQTYTEK